MKAPNDYKTAQQYANAFARSEGYGKATGIKAIPGKGPVIVEAKQPGYVKNTTGEYVPNAYRTNFGWKNTHYQPLVCIVGIPEGTLALWETKV